MSNALIVINDETNKKIRLVFEQNQSTIELQYIDFFIGTITNDVDHSDNSYDDDKDNLTSVDYLNKLLAESTSYGALGIYDTVRVIYTKASNTPETYNFILNDNSSKFGVEKESDESLWYYHRFDVRHFNISDITVNTDGSNVKDTFNIQYVKQNTTVIKTFTFRLGFVATTEDSGSIEVDDESASQQQTIKIDYTTDSVVYEETDSDTKEFGNVSNFFQSLITAGPTLSISDVDFQSISLLPNKWNPVNFSVSLTFTPVNNYEPFFDNDTQYCVLDTSDLKVSVIGTSTTDGTEIVSIVNVDFNTDYSDNDNLTGSKIILKNNAVTPNPFTYSLDSPLNNLDILDFGKLLTNPLTLTTTIQGNVVISYNSRNASRNQYSDNVKISSSVTTQPLISNILLVGMFLLMLVSIVIVRFIIINLREN